MNLQRRKSKVLALAIVAVAGVLGIWWTPALAQSAGWNTPQLIFEGRGSIFSPALVADRFGQVHAFWIFQPDQSEGDNQGQLVYYTRLDQPTWPVNDIFAVPKAAGTLQAIMNADGLALLWAGRFFAWSGPSPHASAKDWNGPLDVLAGYAEAGLAVAPDGALWMTYGAGTNDIYVQRLNPDTGAWQAPQLVGDPTNPNTAPDGVRLAISADGRMHVVWAEYQLPNGWPPVGLYYAQSSDGGLAWSGRRRMAGALFNQPNVVVGPGQSVYVTWTGTAGAGQKYFQESIDGGQTWEGPIKVIDQGGGGSEGPPNLAVDSGGNLHMVFSHNGCVWYTRRENSIWSNPECISLGAARNAAIEQPVMALGLGNQLHVFFWTDRRQLWYTTLTLPIAGQAPQPTVTPIVPTATSVVPTTTPTPSPTPLPDYGPMAQPGQATQPGVWALVAGVVPVVVLFVVVAVSRRQRPR